MTNKVAIHWFRQDLRLSDNPALINASKHKRVLPIYILDDEAAGKYAMGGASHWWLHYALMALNQSLNHKLCVYQASAQAVFEHILKHFDVEAVYWNRCYEPWRIACDTDIKAYCKTKGIVVQTSNASLLWEPETIKKDDGTPYKVFTPFYQRGCLKAPTPRAPLQAPKHIQYLVDEAGRCTIDSLGLLPKVRWDVPLQSCWQIGEQGAYQRLEAFIEAGLAHYKAGRDFPAKPYVSRLSPYLHFGEISPHQLWYAVRSMGDNQQIEHFCRELAWREFSYAQLYYHPTLPHKNLQSKFDAFPWKRKNASLQAWQQGQTGVPMVDAGMRELWQTGYMHNRVRMIVGSFLVKNLLLHWHHGERWFWDTLVDADLANNSASWQWVAGCGADAAPYFRIFNPVTQGKKFDPDGHYIRQYIPEIAALPNKYLFSPWEAPDSVLDAAGITLGKTYPHPIVDLKHSREVALEAFASLKQGR